MTPLPTPSTFAQRCVAGAGAPLPRRTAPPLPLSSLAPQRPLLRVLQSRHAASTQLTLFPRPGARAR